MKQLVRQKVFFISIFLCGCASQKFVSSSQNGFWLSLFSTKKIERKIASDNTETTTQRGFNYQPIKQSKYDGIWSFYDFECEPGGSVKLTADEVKNIKTSGSFFQLIFNQGQLTMRGKDVVRNCVIEGEADYTIAGDILKFIRGKGVETCGKEKYKVFPDNSPITVKIRENKDRESEFLIKTPAGLHCTNGKHGFAVLKREIMG